MENVSCMENPRGSLRERPYMQEEQLPLGFKRDTVDQCAFGRDYRKTTDVFNDIEMWEPTGTTGNGRCGGQCKKGEFCKGYYRHFKALAMEPCRGPRGPGHTKEKNALPFGMLEEILLAAIKQTGMDPRGKVIIDLCSGFQSWLPVARKYGCTYVAVDVLGNRDLPFRKYL